MKECNCKKEKGDGCNFCYSNKERLSSKKELTLNNLLKMIEYLPSVKEPEQWAVFKIIYEDKNSMISKNLNYDAVRDILNHSPEGTQIRKKARNELENIYEYITEMTFCKDTLKEKSELLRKLIRLAIIAY